MVWILTVKETAGEENCTRTISYWLGKIETEILEKTDTTEVSVVSWGAP